MNAVTMSQSKSKHANPTKKTLSINPTFPNDTVNAYRLTTLTRVVTENGNTVMLGQFPPRISLPSTDSPPLSLNAPVLTY